MHATNVIYEHCYLAQYTHGSFLRQKQSRVTTYLENVEKSQDSEGVRELRKIQGKR